MNDEGSAVGNTVTVSGRGLVARLRRLVPRRRSGRHLVVSYLFPPAAETSGLVAAKRVREMGHVVDVIANEPPAGRKPDPGAEQIAGDLVRDVKRLAGTQNKLTDWCNVERFAATGLSEIRRCEKANGQYESVYSRSMMPASHVLAALHKLDHPHVPWVAEFSDPLVLDTRGEQRFAPADGPVADDLRAELARRGRRLRDGRNMFELVEAITYALADTVLFTNENQRELMLATIEDPQLRDRVVRNCEVRPHPQPDASLYRAAEARTKLAPDTLNIGYFGVFFGTRSVTSLTAPFAALDREERDRVRLHLWVPRPRRTREKIADLGLADVVVVHGFVPYLEFLNLTTKLDLLVVADAVSAEHHPVNPYLPSKLSDYLGSGTPIWALVEEGSPMSRVDGITTTLLGDLDAATAHLRAMIAAAS